MGGNLQGGPLRALSTLKSNSNLNLHLEILERNLGNHIHRVIISPQYFKTAPVTKTKLDSD